MLNVKVSAISTVLLASSTPFNVVAPPIVVLAGIFKFGCRSVKLLVVKLLVGTDLDLIFSKLKSFAKIIFLK